MSVGRKKPEYAKARFALFDVTGRAGGDRYWPVG